MHGSLLVDIMVHSNYPFEDVTERESKVECISLTEGLTTFQHKSVRTYIFQHCSYKVNSAIIPFESCHITVASACISFYLIMYEKMHDISRDIIDKN